MLKGTCDRDVGPAGVYDCFNPNNGSQYQWATCVKVSYIMASYPNVSSTDMNASYDWSECMMERYLIGDDAGVDECGCEPGRKPNEPSLASKCYSPDGTDCDWYEDCLRGKYPCSDDAEGRFITVQYGQTFCNLYSQKIDYISNVAADWIDKVRRCLQLRLVPYVRDFGNSGCPEIKQLALDSQEPCYMDSGMCKLTCREWAQAFWNIRKSFGSGNYTSTVKEMFASAEKCDSKSTLSMNSCLQADQNTGGERGVMRYLKFTSDNSDQTEKSNLKESDGENSVYRSIKRAQTLSTKLATHQKWRQNSIGYMAFGSSDSEGRIEVQMLLTDWKIIEGKTDSTAQLNATVTRLLDELENGITLKIKVDEVSLCADVACDTTYRRAKVVINIGSTTYACCGIYLLAVLITFFLE